MIYTIFLLLYALLITFIAVRDMLIRKAFYKYRLTILILLIFTLVVIIFFFQEIEKHPNYLTFINYFLLAIFIGLSVLLAFVSRTSLVKKEIDSVMFDSFSENSYAVFVTDKLKIDQISNKFLKELGITDPSTVIGKNVINVLAENLRIDSLNNLEYRTKKDLESLFNLRSSNIEDFEINITYYNTIGVYSTLTLYQKEIFNNKKYAGSIYYSKETHLPETTNNLIENYTKTTSDFNSLKDRFNSLLDVIDTGVYFLDKDDRSIWFNDKLVDMLNLRYNTLSVSDFYASIHKKDYKAYFNVINTLSKDNPSYEVRYRFKVDVDEYVFLVERAKALFKGDDLYFIAANIQLLSPIGFKRESNDFLDQLQGENELLVHLSKLTKETRRYQLIYLRVNNIPTINEELGRQIGSVVLGDYVRTLANYFSSAEDFYRISGLDFVFLIKHDSKIQKFRRVLEQKNILTADLVYGTHGLKMDAYLGIAFSKDGTSGKEVYKMAKDALLKAISSKEIRHYLYYTDLEVLR